MTTEFNNLSSISSYKKTAYSNNGDGNIIKRYAIKVTKKKGKVAYLKETIDKNGKKRYFMSYKTIK